MKISKVIYFSACNFESIYQRPQALSNAFSSLGYDVTYVTQLPIHRFYKQTNLKKKVKQNISLINVLSISNYFQNRRNVWSSFLEKNELASIESILDDSCLVIIGSPIWTRYAKVFGHRVGKIIYDCYDDWGALEKNHRLDLDELEKELVSFSDIVTVTASALKKKIECMCKYKKIVMVPNAVEAGKFGSGAGKGLEVKAALSLTGPVAGFLGAIYDWVDEDLLYRLAVQLPWLNLVMCGPVQGFDVGRLSKLQNVFFVGMVHYDDVPAYIDMFDVALVPFRKIERMKTVNSNKFYQYLCLGKPVVAIDMPSLKEFGDLIIVANDAKEFINNVEKACLVKEFNSDIMRRRIEYAKRNDWTERAKTILNSIEGKIGKK